MRVLVTGASRGLGMGICQVFLRHGHHVIAAVRNPKRAGPLGELQKSYGTALSIVAMDVSREPEIAAARKEVARLAPTLDVIINNAGIEGNRCKRVEEADAGDIEQTFRVNVLGPILVTKHFASMLQGSRGGIIVNISSDAGSLTEIPLKYYGYCISKAALNMFTRLCARELKNRGIRVFAVHPGWVKTAMGGEEAPLMPETAAEHLYRLILDPPEEALSGAFVDYTGKRKPY